MVDTTGEARNVNVGVMGHVDAGKTTLARFISTTASTAAFDKNPQSVQRGITLDLGFSSFHLPPPTNLQVTLVDCPGHASLFKAVIGAASIIDAVLLVVDGRVGFQVQTAECLVLAEIVTERLVVVVTKIDLVETEAGRGKMMARIRRGLAKTKFCTAPIVPVSFKIESTKASLLAVLANSLSSIPPLRQIAGPPLVSIDHCFLIKGKTGVIMTGTVLSGTISVGDQLEALQTGTVSTSFKARSIQSFRREISSAGVGDRIGLQMVPIKGNSVDVGQLERIILAAPSLLRATSRLLLPIKVIPHYRSPLGSGSKFHVSILHQTAIATVTFFHKLTALGSEYKLLKELPSDPIEEVWALFRFETFKVFAPPAQLVVISRLDTDIKSKSCRLAMYGHVQQLGQPKPLFFRWKERMGKIDRLKDPYRLIGKELTRTAAGLSTFLGAACSVINADGLPVAKGTIENTFGVSGKFIVSLDSPLDRIDTSWRIQLRQKVPLDLLSRT